MHLHALIASAWASTKQFKPDVHWHLYSYLYCDLSHSIVNFNSCLKCTLFHNLPPSQAISRYCLVAGQCKIYCPVLAFDPPMQVVNCSYTIQQLATSVYRILNNLNKLIW